MSTNNIATLLFALALIVGAIFYLGSQSPARPSNVSQTVTPPILTQATTAPAAQDEKAKSLLTSRAAKAKQYPLAKEIVNPSGFINTPDGKPIAIQSLIGKKVILLDIWTYSCINCQRTFPYLKSWYDKYKDRGLEIIGSHAPDFEFEKDYGNVLAAVKKFGITYPVVLDNDFATARGYGMRYWPEEYLIDIDGFIVHKSVGEGGYEETEAKIVALLNERSKVLGENGTVSAPASAADAGAASRPESPETYFGSARNQYLANGKQGVSGMQRLSLPETFERNRLYLGGEWNIAGEFAENQNAGASIVFKYKAKEVYFVASAKREVRAKIWSDGVLVRNNKGEDVATDGSVFIKEDRLYKIIKNQGLEEHTLKIEIESAELRAYTFTFG